MTSLTTRDLLAIGGQLVAGGARPLGPISIDSRTVGSGQVFFCIRGPRFDGHDFALAAVNGGAGVVVCERGAARRVAATLAGRATVIAVGDTVRALGLLASRHRARFAGTVVALTGSSGKTTTKEMIAAVLGRAGSTLKTEGNLNNHLGVPLTLLALAEHHAFAVVEMGMSDRGEIAYLAELARPQVGVITSIGAAHLATLGDTEAVARAKGELLQALPPNGLGVIPSDVPHAWVLTRGIQAPLIAVGGRRTDAVRLTGLREGARGVSGDLHVDGERYRLRMKLTGEHNLRNAMLAVAVGRALGVAPAAAIEALSQVEPPKLRGEVRHLVDGTPVVLDCYNANPQSMTAALTAFARRAPQGVAVLGDMLELGEAAAAAHLAVGRLVAKTPGLALVAVGRHATEMVDAARQAGISEAVAVPDAAAAAEHLARTRAPGRPILLKGSRGVRLEQVFSALANPERTS